MPAQRVNPTRIELLRLKRRLTTAVRGHKLLKDKRDEMVRRFMLLIRENRELRVQVEQELVGALREFALARAVMPAEAIEEAVMMPSRQLTVTLGVQNIMSVVVPTLSIDEGELNESALPYAFPQTSAQLDGAIETLSGILPRMVKLAEIEKTCSRLADEIEKTRRRVNALEYVSIPRMKDSIRMITMKLDENERGNLTRLMKVKDMIAEREA